MSKYMKEKNIEGSSRGFIPRIIDSYSSITVEKVRKYFLSTLKFCKLYTEGETGYTVNKRMQEMRKNKRCHRGAAQAEVDHSGKAYNRHRNEFV